MNVVIVGMRGAGKSNVSRRLALISKRPALSTDDLVRYETGLSIPEFVREEGWPTFRDVECQVLEKLLAIDSAVIDCGGGIMVDVDHSGSEVLSKRKAELLSQLGTVVWLAGDLDRLAAKANRGKRPVLSDEISVRDIMERRLPWYEQIADVTVNIEGMKRQAIAEKIAVDLLGGWSDPGSEKVPGK